MTGRRSANRVWPWLTAAVVVAGGTLLWNRRDQAPALPTSPPASVSASASSIGAKASVTYAEAKPILDALHDRLPAELRTKTPPDLESAWPAWVRAHDAEVRARLARGDEDSIVNFWMFGTSFTTRPRATAPDLASHGGRAATKDVLLGRLEDLITAVGAPGSNERLRFARQVIDRRGIDPATPDGREQARTYLIDLHERVISDNERYRNAARAAGQLSGEQARLAAFASAYRDRGLSSDTSLPIDYALDETLKAARAQGRLTGGVRRAAIIGPGLDFTDKADGFDFYPQQTIQPFALVDSLTRLKLAAPDGLRVTTFDLSPRVNQHLDSARARAERGEPYVLQLPLATNDPAHVWEPGLVEYWRACGTAIGDAVPGLAPPPAPTRVDVRAVRVRPAVVLSITARDLNVVLERPAALDAAERFDLIVATNVLVYYDAFEQALALQNVASMLRPGGYFVTNVAVSPAAPMQSTPSLVTTTYWDRQRNFDTLFWHQRK